MERPNETHARGREPGSFASAQSVVVVGAGYIGYPLALLLASVGHDVLAVDADPAVVAAIDEFEPLLDEDRIALLAADPATKQRLSASSAPAEAMSFVIAVPTPLRAGSRAADLSAVEAATRSLVPHVRSGNLVIVESTVPPGTTVGLISTILSESGLTVGEDLLLAYCPERLHPGSVLNELKFNARIIGGINSPSSAAALEFYSTFVEADLIETDVRTAELCKLFENAYRDVNIALANQMAQIAEQLGADAVQVLDFASLHPRVDYLEPGIGVGGHCIPVDPWFLYGAAAESASLIAAARVVNDERPARTAQQIAAAVTGIRDPNVVLVGASYKPNVSDTRNSPALLIAEILPRLGVGVTIHDDMVSAYDSNLIDDARGADLLAVLVPHTKMLERIVSDRDEIAAVMRRPWMLDFTNGSPRPL